MELVSTIEISGEEREIADAVAREQINSLNSNLDTLSYGENSGSANLFDKSKIVRGACIGSDGYPYGDDNYGYSDYIHVEPNTEYTFMNVGWFNYYDANKSYVSQSTGGTSTTPSNAKYVIVSFELSVVNSVMVAKFHQTEYVPYIPSVKMLADEVSTQNESLDNYGLLNVFDGVWKQGGVSSSNGSETSYTTSIHGKNKIPISGGQKIKLKYSTTAKYLYARFYKSDGTYITQDLYGENVSEITLTAPENSASCFVGVEMTSEITPQTAGKLFVYIDNQIDVLKNDLSKQCKKDDITTNETLIGTFNGKNYYRKLFTGISGSGGSVTVNVGEKIEIYNYYGRAYTYGQSGASDVKYPIPNKNYYIDNQNASETSFQLTIPTSSDTRKVDLVIEYTKVDE